MALLFQVLMRHPPDSEMLIQPPRTQREKIYYALGIFIVDLWKMYNTCTLYYIDDEQNP